MVEGGKNAEPWLGMDTGSLRRGDSGLTATPPTLPGCEEAEDVEEDEEEGLEDRGIVSPEYNIIYNTLYNIISPCRGRTPPGIKIHE